MRSLAVFGSRVRGEAGPMLRHGLQGIEGATIQVSRRLEWQPDPELLGIRFARFWEAR